MVQITVYVATLNGPSAPPPFQLAGQPLSFYLTGPMTSAGPAIEIALDFSRYNVLPTIGGNAVGQSQLLSALGQLLGPVTPGPSPVVGLILTKLYAQNPSAEGFMFDLMATPGAPFGPRQGCALFLDAIAAVAGNNSAAVSERLTFQAVHELGHALNLWHIPPFLAGPNFMTAPPPSNIAPALRFIQPQSDYVSHAVDPMTNGYVLPGGSDFGVRGPLAAPGGDLPYAIDLPRSALALKIALSHRRFYAVEPVELDVEIALAKGAKATKYTIPAEVDPGHARLKLWITSPNGEKRLYRSAVHYCGTGEQIRISKTKPFRRDISIYWSAEGFTFTSAGKYTLQATYQLSPRHLLRSNKISCEVLESSGAVRRSMAALWHPDAVSLLHRKDTIPGKKLDADLSAYAAISPHATTSALIRYALGRAFAKTANAGVHLSSQDRQRGAKHLTAALQISALGGERKRKARRSLKDLTRN